MRLSVIGKIGYRKVERLVICEPMASLYNCKQRAAPIVENILDRISIRSIKAVLWCIKY
jgi:hypothetical protein